MTDLDYQQQFSFKDRVFAFGTFVKYQALFFVEWLLDEAVGLSHRVKNWWNSKTSRGSYSTIPSEEELEGEGIFDME